MLRYYILLICFLFPSPKTLAQNLKKNIRGPQGPRKANENLGKSKEEEENLGKNKENVDFLLFLFDFP